MRNHERNMKEVGFRLDSAIKDGGKTKTEIANLLDVNMTSIVNWCKGHNYPSLANLIDISDLLGKPVGYFLDGEEKEKTASFSKKDLQIMKELYSVGTISDKIYYMWVAEKLEEVMR